MPIMGQMTTKFQARYLIAFGWLCSGHRHVLFDKAD
jgi:hypothetical protein